MTDWPDLDKLDPELVKRYDQRGPRYTSYPTAPQFTDDVDREALMRRIRATSVQAEPAALSIYVHVPYCQSKCLYCGCHSVAIQDDAEPGCYLDEVLREVALWSAELGPKRQVAQLALGGGSPSTLGAAGLERLVTALDQRFAPEPSAERSIELDPNRVDEAFLDAILETGFNRLSFGIQDFEEKVLRRVGRREDPAWISRLLTFLRGRGFEAISFDLMLGLPGQTSQTLTRTLRQVIRLGPSRLALFPYAHVPWIRPHQQALERYELPSSADRLGLYAVAHRLLGEAGYLAVGMDHFAGPDDELIAALRQHRLHRNFMGYTTRPGLDLIGLGVSSISDIGAAYAQHTKDLDVYRGHLDAGRLPFERGFLLSEDDLARRELIMDLLCNFQADVAAIGERFGLDWQQAFGDDLARLAPLEADGLIRQPAGNGTLEVTPLGKPFVRLVCMAFDRYLARSEAQYSKTL